MTLTVFTGGTIVVAARADGSTELTEALAIEAGRVVAHGCAALDLASQDGAQTIDLAGGTLAPAVGEGHAHPVLGGLEAQGPAVREAKDLAGILDAVKTWKQQNPSAEWIVGASYDATFAPGGRFDARWLDEVTGDTPTVLRSWDYHTVWVNTAALKAAGITADTPDPELGRILRRKNGAPLGTLQEAAANDLLANVVPAFALETRVSALEAATLAYAEQGTTWVQDAWVDPADLDTYRVAARTDRLHTRVNLALRADPANWREQIAEFIAVRKEIRALAHPRLSAETIKFFVDGVIENHTAALTDDYADTPGDRGLANWSEDDLTAAVAALDAAGFQLHLHAIGDRAVRIALDALEAARDVDPGRDRHHVVAHVAMLAPADVERFAQLGVIANFEPYWAQCDAVMQSLTIPHIGHDRDSWQYLIGSIARSGATVSFGSDWPVTTKDWRPAFATAVTRRDVTNPEDPTWLPDECISPATAYAAYTEGIARQALAHDRGSLEVGRVADLVWLSANPLEVAPELVPELEVRGTWLAGDVTYAKN
ncbi:putative amidohydrolase YtcJ [Leucobacter exalbidus]|uniref:Amidohydrolase YtcJ n=1 Tax=Leucobacter exalbidus TaxID=662960 RepID=A0A940PX40_9MICO|nr:amidohydrolase [Leucobacter exalbidus]MBP1326949.1 putative amidohydrolase YtcJ [Leucobacter exalbidus]